MVTAPKRVVKVTAWLSFLYSEVQKEKEYQENVILELLRQEQNPRHIASDIGTAYELALHCQYQLYKSDLANLQEVHLEAYLWFKAASKQFAGKVQIGMQYLVLSMEQRTQEVGNELHSRVNMGAAVNAEQMQRIEKCTTSSENNHSALRLSF